MGDLMSTNVREQTIFVAGEVTKGTLNNALMTQMPNWYAFHINPDDLMNKDNWREGEWGGQKGTFISFNYIPRSDMVKGVPNVEAFVPREKGNPARVAVGVASQETGEPSNNAEIQIS